MVLFDSELDDEKWISSSLEASRQHSAHSLSEYSFQCPADRWVLYAFHCTYIWCIHKILYYLSCHISYVQLDTNIFNREWSLGLDLSAPTFSLYAANTLYCTYTQDRITLDSEKERFLAVKYMLSSAAHLSLNRIMKSSGAWRRVVEGGDGTMLKECGRMWETKEKIERTGWNRSNWVDGQVRKT